MARRRDPARPPVRPSVRPSVRTEAGSLFRTGVAARLAGAAGLSALLWAAILWASA